MVRRTVTPFRSLDDLLSAIKADPAGQVRAGPEPVWFFPAAPVDLLDDRAWMRPDMPGR